MFANSPFTHDLHVLLTRAADFAGDRTQPEPLRRSAAGLCTTLAREGPPDEALCTALLRAAMASTGSPLVVLDLVGAARAAAPDEAGLVGPLLRLCGAAHEGRNRGSIVATLVVLVALDGFNGQVPAEWLQDAGDVEPDITPLLKGLVLTWVTRFGGNNDGVLGLVRECQDSWFLTPRKRQWFRLADLLALHLAQPTAAGWIALARRRSELPRDPLPLSFGDRYGGALTALRDALARNLDPLEHVVLERWLAALVLQ